MEYSPSHPIPAVFDQFSSILTHKEGRRETKLDFVRILVEKPNGVQFYVPIPTLEGILLKNVNTEEKDSMMNNFGFVNTVSIWPDPFMASILQANQVYSSVEYKDSVRADGVDFFGEATDLEFEKVKNGKCSHLYCRCKCPCTDIVEPLDDRIEPCATESVHASAFHPAVTISPPSTPSNSPGCQSYSYSAQVQATQNFELAQDQYLPEEDLNRKVQEVDPHQFMLSFISTMNDLKVFLSFFYRNHTAYQPRILQELHDLLEAMGLDPYEDPIDSSSSEASTIPSFASWSTNPSPLTPSTRSISTSPPLLHSPISPPFAPYRYPLINEAPLDQEVNARLHEWLDNLHLNQASMISVNTGWESEPTTATNAPSSSRIH